MNLDLFSISLWTAVIIYALSAAVCVCASIFRSARFLTAGFALAALGLTSQLVAVALRWQAVGHGPYLGFYESVSFFALLSVVSYIALVLWKRSLKVIGSVVMPIAFLLLGIAAMTPKADLGITASLASIWLVIHVFFAQISYTALFIAFVLAVLYLLRARKPEQKSRLFARLPNQAIVDDLVFRFIAIGFILWTIMIITGAVWANEAWGRYWGWDPIETWSLIVWIVYALCLHLRLTLGWKEQRFALLALTALPITLFSLIGVPLLWNSIHAAYLNFGG